jgi:hypothetical protein
MVFKLITPSSGSKHYKKKPNSPSVFVSLRSKLVLLVVLLPLA